MKCLYGVPLLGLLLAIGLGPASGTPAASPPDPRLEQPVTLAIKATALSALCERLQAESGVAFTADASVADEKVTLFCRKMPLREVMRQLSRPFGYSWLRSSTLDAVRQRSMLDAQRSTGTDTTRAVVAGAERRALSVERQPAPGVVFRYELVQDLNSQQQEEDLRNRDRRAALRSLDGEMSAYRPYLALSPDEALQRAASAPADEKKRLQRFAGYGWGPAQLYFRLSPADLAALRAGQTLKFAAQPKEGERALPPGIARGVLASMRDWRLARRGDVFHQNAPEELPDGLPLSSFPELRPLVYLTMRQSELGQFTLEGTTGFTIEPGPNTKYRVSRESDITIAVGANPAAREPGNAAANAALARDPALQAVIAVAPQPSCGPVPAGTPRGSDAKPPPEPKATSADVLEALHQATGMPIVADYYTRLYLVSAVSTGKRTLFDALNTVADTMRLRWRKEGEWLQFRSVSYYDDRLKEVPNRLLERWAAARREHGNLIFEDLIEIVRLTDVQLGADRMAEGARLCWGLAEWNLARDGGLRPHLRSLAALSPEQRGQAGDGPGLPFAQLPAAQQREFLTRAISEDEAPVHREELDQAALRWDYAVPGWFEWAPWGGPRMRSPSDRFDRGLALVRERTREAALQAARQILPDLPPDQIVPTELQVRIVYALGDPATGRGRRYLWATQGASVGSR